MARAVSAEQAAMQARVQALRDILMRAHVLNLIDPQARVWERVDVSRRFRQISISFALVGSLVAVALDIAFVVFLFTHGYHRSDMLSPPAQWGMVLGGFLFLNAEVFSPLRYRAASADALLAALSSVGANPRLATMAAPQPPSAMLTPGAEETLTLLKWNTDRETKALRDRRILLSVLAGGSLLMSAVMALPVYLAFAVIGGPVPFLQIFAGAFALLGLALLGYSVWAAVSVWRAAQAAQRIQRELPVTVGADGLVWDDHAWRSPGPQRLAWRAVRSFSVTTYQPATDGERWRVYILDGGQTRLLWVIWPSAPAQLHAAHDRLVSLIVGATSQPLQDATPGVVALGSLLRNVAPLDSTPAEQTFATTQPTIPGAPVAALRRWKWIYQRIVLALCLVLMTLSVLVVGAALIARL